MGERGLVRTVADAMIAPPVSVAPATTVQRASAAMLEAGVHAALVVDGHRVCGLLTAERVSRALGEGHDAAATPVAAIAEPEPPTVRPEEPLAEVHERMRAAGHEVLAVASRRAEPVGLLIGT